ncbi:LacI family DNA-binding transcriptional regulator [Streptomyces sp. NPDC102381]|uniref:LacI family DNA-binding transcriptional regulator n=1 Tax=Streptomyces sp. NPDC102381 TaxID=3366164 RepID=UPI00380F5530
MPEQVPTSGAKRGSVTLYEVAKLAGVSHMTVSRFLRKEPTVSPETARRVAKAVEELDFRPSPAARAMRTGKSNRIAVFLPESPTAAHLKMLGGVADSAHDAGYFLDVVYMGGTPQVRTDQLKKLLVPGTIDGVLSLTPLPDGTEQLKTANLDLPVIVDGEYDGSTDSQEILTDASSMKEIIHYLALLGHRRFFHVAGPAAWASARNRRTTYETTIAELGLESSAVIAGDWTVKSGWDAATRIIADSKVTAVIAANDRSAIGVIRGLHDLGIDVPKQVSVVGWDDDEVGRYLAPTLSTVSVNHERQGEDAIDRLLALLRGQSPAGPPAAATLNRFVPRGSTGPAPACTT